MEHSSKTKQIFLTTIVLVIVASVAYIILFLNIKEKNNNISALTNEVDNVLQKEIKLRSVGHLIKDTQEDRAKLGSHFVADDEVVDFIEIVEDLGVESGAKVEITNVGINTINEEALNKGKFNELLSIDFKIEGRFVEMFHFLSMFEKLPFKVDIRTVNFEKIPEEKRRIDKSLKPWKGFFSITVEKLK